MEKTTNKTIITVVGKDTVGIIVQGYFNMMMIVDMNTSEKPFADCAADLEKLGEEIGVSIKCQREEIFDMMHRL